MPRVREVAQKIGVEIQAAVEACHRLGLADKKASSILSAEEEARVTQELQRKDPNREANLVGAERVIQDVDGQTKVERRVKAGIIRRRSSAPSSSSAAAFGGESTAATASAAPADVVSPLSGPEPLPEALLDVLPPPLGDTPLPQAPAPSSIPELQGSHGNGAEPAPLGAQPEVVSTGSAEQAALCAQETVGATSAEAAAATGLATPDEASSPQAAVTESKAATTTSSRPTVRVVGKVDLTRANRGASQPASPGARVGREPTPARRSPLPPPEVPSLADFQLRPRKKGKKQVFEKSDLLDSQDQGRRRPKPPRKKKPAPGAETRKTEITLPRAAKRVVRIHGAVTVQDLARLMSVRLQEVVKKLLELGIQAKATDSLDADTAAIVANEFEFTVENVSFDAEQELQKEITAHVDRPEDLEPRPPVVTVMGHVDHGKTSLLDAIRKTNVTAQEAGGITQHIGAYSVDVHGRKITFLDTPGHEAFTAMRARGAKVTDLVILVVAADDGVMPQTKEAINHARAAGVPIVVALTKVDKLDKRETNVDRVKSQLADLGLTPDGWGGDAPVVPVSAKTGEGIPDLLEMVLLQADILELRANPKKPAIGTIVEAKLDRGKGPVATVLVKEGTLRVGDVFVCGPQYGKVRAMFDDRGNRVTEAGPSVPVEVLGLEGVPEAGSSFVVMQDEARARQIAESRRDKMREESLAGSARLTLEDLHRRAAAGEIRELPVVLKADVQGSVEAVSEALSRLSTPEVSLKILHASVGGITESDVLLASASNAIVIGFNVRPESKASEAAERERVQIRLYEVIYDVIDEVRSAMEGLLAPQKVEKILGRAEVREVFRVPSAGTVAGCFVPEGKIVRNAHARLIRDNKVVYTGRIGSLRRFREDVREVTSGYECGITLENYQDIKVGDRIEVFEIEEVAPRLAPSPRPAVGAERRV